MRLYFGDIVSQYLFRGRRITRQPLVLSTTSVWLPNYDANQSRCMETIHHLLRDGSSFPGKIIEYICSPASICAEVDRSRMLYFWMPYSWRQKKNSQQQKTLVLPAGSSFGVTVFKIIIEKYIHHAAHDRDHKSVHIHAQFDSDISHRMYFCSAWWQIFSPHRAARQWPRFRAWK